MSVNMLKVYITRGLPASGKSTWAMEKLKTNLGNIKRINKDLLREMLDGGHWSRGNEKFVISVRDFLIREALENGKHVIVDDTNLNPAHIGSIKEIVKVFNAKVEMIDFTDVGVDECIARDRKRPNYVGEKVIREMYNRWLKPLEYKEPKKAEQDPSLPHAIICDLDGTLALMGDRNPYDASTCINDEVNEAVNHILNSYHNNSTYTPGSDGNSGYIIFLSGRTDKYREQTDEWLAKKAGHHTEDEYIVGLFMRKEGDTRKDAIVKKEILENEIKGEYYIDFILDDRDAVVEMWREEGYTCLQVAEGNF